MRSNLRRDKTGDIKASGKMIEIDTGDQYTINSAMQREQYPKSCWWIILWWTDELVGARVLSVKLIGVRANTYDDRTISAPS